MISHHLPESMMMAYAAGTASEEEALFIACHLTLCPHCRDRLAGLEAIGGALLDASPAPDDGVEDLLAGLLDRLDEPAPVVEPPVVDPDGVLPAPLAARVGPFSRLSFTPVYPGVGRHLVAGVASEGMPMRLFRLKPGSTVPEHTHVGRELTLVLTGGFTDAFGHFTRGDVEVRHDESHSLQIDPGEPCIVLSVADEPLVPRSLRAHLAQLFRTL